MNYLEGNTIKNNNNNYESPVNQEMGFDDEYTKDFLRSQLKSLKEKLGVMGFPPIGDLFSVATSEIQITMKAYIL